MQGLLLINKPKDITSFGAVSIVRRKANTKKVGHTGTLDPLATGVLPILVGRATALSPYLLNADKQYIATVKLGIVTDTLDITGQITEQRAVCITEDILKDAISHFLGEQEQYPPIYSAIKKDGVPLYKLARKGQQVEVEPRKINIFSIELINFCQKENTFSIRVHCSKGTYIRSLCRDIGEYLGCGATMTDLIRTKTGPFTLDKCVSPDILSEDNIKDYIINEELAVSHLKELYISEKQAFRFSNGGKLAFNRLKTNVISGELYRVKFNDRFIGIGYADGENEEIRIKCLINPIN